VKVKSQSEKSFHSFILLNNKVTLSFLVHFHLHLIVYLSLDLFISRVKISQDEDVDEWLR
jgi:hypothetical protein